MFSTSLVLVVEWTIYSTNGKKVDELLQNYFVGESEKNNSKCIGEDDI